MGDREMVLGYNGSLPMIEPLQAEFNVALRKVIRATEHGGLADRARGYIAEK